MFHRSATYDEDYRDLRSLSLKCDIAVIVFRDPYATMQSQEWTGSAYSKLLQGYRELFRAFSGNPIPTVVVTSEALVLNPHALDWLLERLRLDPSQVTEEVTNENAKHYA